MKNTIYPIIISFTVFLACNSEPADAFYVSLLDQYNIELNFKNNDADGEVKILPELMITSTSKEQPLVLNYRALWFSVDINIRIYYFNERLGKNQCSVLTGMYFPRSKFVKKAKEELSYLEEKTIELPEAGDYLIKEVKKAISINGIEANDVDSITIQLGFNKLFDLESPYKEIDLTFETNQFVLSGDKLTQFLGINKPTLKEEE